jgi:hypothetical protein
MNQDGKINILNIEKQTAANCSVWGTDSEGLKSENRLRA